MSSNLGFRICLQGAQKIAVSSKLTWCAAACGFGHTIRVDVMRGFMCFICSLLFCCVQTPWDSECDVWWDEVMKDSPEECEPEWLDAEDPLFILYTSGSTGKPKVRDTGVCTWGETRVAVEIFEITLSIFYSDKPVMVLTVMVFT